MPAEPRAPTGSVQPAGSNAPPVRIGLAEKLKQSQAKAKDAAMTADFFENFAQKSSKPSLAQRLSAHGNKHHKKHHHEKAAHHATLLQQSNLMTMKGKFAEDDMFHEEDNEDDEIMKSIAYAEKKLGK